MTPAPPRSRRLGVATAALLFAAVALASCSRDRETPSLPGEILVGTWRAILLSPGGELPFGLEIRRGDVGLEAVIHNGDDETALSDVVLDGRHAVLGDAAHDSTIDAELGEAGKTLRGSWQLTSAEGSVTHLPFEAEKGRTERFLPLDEAGIEPVGAAAIDSVDGVWDAEFADGNDTEPARGELRQRGHRVLGAFLTPSGDYQPLEGTYERGVLRLSTFDGEHAFLCVARAQDDGSLRGDLWSGDTYHVTWTAERQPPYTGR